MNDFQKTIIAAQDLRDECKTYGIRLTVNSDGTVTLYHGTSDENAQSILKNGFSEGAYFSHAKNVTGYSDEGPSWYANVKNKNGRILEIRVDASCVEFVSSTGEFYCPKSIRFDSSKNCWCDAASVKQIDSLNELIEKAERNQKDVAKPAPLPDIDKER